MAAVGARASLSFRETLQRHLEAMQNRELAALADTVAQGPLILVTAEGKLVRSSREFLDAHRAWFEMNHWSLYVTPVEIYESADMGVALLHLLYCENAPQNPAVRQQSHLTLVFQKRNGKWLMVQDQNTPIK